MAKEVETFIGPCSKYITGQGWTTEIPVEQLQAKGYCKKAEIERLTEELKERHINNFKYAQNLKKENTELQKQVDELKRENNFLHVTIQNAEPYRQGGKDTAKEILQTIMHIIKKSGGFLAEEVIRIMAKTNGVEVE